MRLRAINVYSSFLGEATLTKERTGFLRKESDFLDYELCKTIKYINNSYCKQLNIHCTENISAIVISRYDEDGYPVIDLPFSLDDYNNKSDSEKGLFWIKSLKDIFSFLIQQYEFDEEKVSAFIDYLEDKYSKSNSYEEIKAKLLQMTH